VSHIENDKDGTSIHSTRDIGGAIERYEQHKFDKMIYVILSQQDLHSAQFIKALHLMEFPWASSIEHVNYGFILGMSKHKGLVFLDHIIRKAASVVTVMHGQMKKNEEKYATVEEAEQTSLKVGLTGIKIQDMAANPINNHNYDWDWMTSFEGDMGPYLQYAHVRLTHKNPELLPTPEQIAAWSCSYSALRSRSRARGRLSWSRARRTSSGRGRGCGYVFVCAGRAWDWDPAAASEHSTVGVHVRDGGVQNFGIRSLLSLFGTLTYYAQLVTYHAAEESKQWKRR